MWVTLSPSHFLKVSLGMMDSQGCWEKQLPLVLRLKPTLLLGDTVIAYQLY